MPAQEVEAWLTSRKPCIIGGVALRPRKNPFLPSTPFSISRGQAEAFYLHEATNAEWILKKFHRGRTPDSNYLQTIRSCLPQLQGFMAGLRRQVIAGPDPASSYATKSLTAWLQGTVLMPRVSGVDWSTLADNLRSGSVKLDRAERAHLCLGLVECIAALEKSGCAHRDLSCGNVYIDKTALQVSLIDWDSMYHPKLQMPANTTAGSQGYIAPFLYQGQDIDAAKTWGPRADRFALAICCSEFLSMGCHSQLHGDGGVFDQADLCRKGGPSVSEARAALAATCPEALILLDRALAAQTYQECPSPDEWSRLAATLCPGQVVPLRLEDVSWPGDEVLSAHLSRVTPPPPVWVAPSLEDLPEIVQLLPPTSAALPAWPAPHLDDLPLIENVPPHSTLKNSRPIPVAPPLPDDPWVRD